MEARSNKLQAKDLINVGIFTAIYFVIFFAGMMLGYIPIFIPLLGLVCPILCGIPFMLYLTKVKKFGMVSLTGIILGLLNLVMGSGVLVLIFSIIFGVLGDVILRTGKYQSWKCTLLGNGVFSLWMHFVELYHGEFSEERLLRALRNIHPVDIYRIGQDDPAKLRGWKKYVFPIYTAYNGKCRKDALPMKF